MLFVQLQSEGGNHSIDEIATSLWLQWIQRDPKYDVEYWRKEVGIMIELGSRYRNIDQHLGFGSSLILGTSLSETM